MKEYHAASRSRCEEFNAPPARRKKYMRSVAIIRNALGCVSVYMRTSSAKKRSAVLFSSLRYR